MNNIVDNQNQKDCEVEIVSKPRIKKEANFQTTHNCNNHNERNKSWMYDRNGNLMNSAVTKVSTNNDLYSISNNVVENLFKKRIIEETRSINAEINYYKTLKNKDKVCREIEWNRRIEFSQWELNRTEPKMFSKEINIPFEIKNDIIPDKLYKIVKIVGIYYNLNPNFILFIIIHLVEIAIHGQVYVEMSSGWKESMCSYGIPILGSGNRKSSLMEMLKKPFNDFITKKNEDDLKNIDRIKTRNKELDKIIKAQKSGIRKNFLNKINDDKINLDDESVEQMFSEIEEVEKRINRHRKKINEIPKIFFGKITEERLFEALYSQGGHISFCDAEPHFLKCNICSNHASVLLSAHDHEYISYETKNSGKVSIEKPSITILQMAQPSVALNFYQNKCEDDDIGFTARFIPCFGQAYSSDERESPDKVKNLLEEEFYPRITALLNRYFTQEHTQKKKIIITRLLLNNSIGKLENEMGQKIRSQKNVFMEPFLRKAHGQAVRYAAAIHAFNHAYEAIEDSVLSEDEIDLGVAIVRGLIPHAEYIFDRKKYTSKHNAIKVIDRLINSTMNNGGLLLDTRVISQMTNIKKEELFDALRILEDHNLCRVVPEPGRAAAVVIHPLFYSLFRSSPEWN